MAVVDVVGDVRSMAWCRLLSGSMLAILVFYLICNTNTRLREYEPPAFPLGASLFLSVERALGEVLQSGAMWTAVRRQAGHPHSILSLKHVVQTKSPQLFRWVPRCSSL